MCLQGWVRCVILMSLIWKVSSHVLWGILHGKLVDCNQPIKEKYLSTLLICISIYLIKLSCHSLPKHFFASSAYFPPHYVHDACIKYCCFLAVSCDYLILSFHPYLKNGACAAHTECLSCVNPSGSIFQFTHAGTSSFCTDLTCRNSVQTGGGSWRAIPALYSEGWIRIRPHEHSFRISGLFAFFCCWIHYWFCRSCHFKTFF